MSTSHGAVSSHSKISVAICTYNGAQYIAEQLNSILNQSISPDEIVLSDDSSEDQTVQIAKTILENQKIVGDWKILRNSQNLGYVKNFEQACKTCTGNLIFLSDQDDVWIPTKVEEFLPAFDDPSILLVFSDGWVTDRSLNPVTSVFSAFEITDAELDQITHGTGFPLFLRRSFATGAATAIRKSLIDIASPFPPPPWHHDEWLAISAAAADGVLALRKKTFYYRQHGRNQIGVPVSSAQFLTNPSSMAIFKNRFIDSINGSFAKQCRARTETLNQVLDRFQSLKIERPEFEAHVNATRAEADFFTLRGHARSLSWLVNLPSYRNIYRIHTDHPYLAMLLDTISALMSIFDSPFQNSNSNHLPDEN